MKDKNPKAKFALGGEKEGQESKRVFSE